MFHVEQNLTYEIVLALLRVGSHPRAIAKDLGVPHTTVLRKLKTLSRDNVIDYREEGKNKVYFIKNTLEARTYIMIVELYKLARTLYLYPHLRSIIQNIQQHPDIQLAVLFGSYAKGTATQKSDIDVYIKTQDRGLKRDLERIHSKLSIKTGEFDRSSILIREIEKDHVILRGVEEYYEKTRVPA